MTTRRPRAVSRLPRLEAVSPLPSEEATPPVTKMCLVVRAEGAKACSRGCCEGSPLAVWPRRATADPRDSTVTPRSVEVRRGGACRPPRSALPGHALPGHALPVTLFLVAAVRGWTAQVAAGS